MRRAVRDAKLDCELTVVRDRAQALALVWRLCPEVPDLVILDLNVPNHDGLEILRTIREDPAYADLRIAILTSSISPAERTKMEALGVDRLFTKPADLDEFMKIGHTIKELLDARRAPSGGEA